MILIYILIDVNDHMRSLFLMDIFVRWFLDLWISLDLASHQTCGSRLRNGQALEGTSDDSAVMEPNEHLAVFFGLYGRYEAHRSTGILNRNLTYVNYCQLRCPWFEFSMYLDVCFSAASMSPVRCSCCFCWSQMERSRLLHLHPGKAMKTDIINPQINFDAVQTEFRKKRWAFCLVDIGWQSNLGALILGHHRPAQV